MRVTGCPDYVVHRDEKTEIVIYAIRTDAREPGYWLQGAQ